MVVCVREREREGERESSPLNPIFTIGCLLHSTPAQQVEDFKVFCINYLLILVLPEELKKVATIIKICSDSCPYCLKVLFTTDN